MKQFSVISMMAVVAFSSCASDNADQSFNGGNDDDKVSVVYPAGSIVWGEDTTVVLTDHYVVPKGRSLYIEKGATVLMANAVVKPEIVVLGNLYSMGTEAKPITFTVPDSLKKERFGRPWGGVICGYDSEELFLNYTTIEYCGAQTTAESPSYRNGLFKTNTGEGVPAVHFCNTQGRMVIENCTFHNNAEDHLYITGGQSIVTKNRFIANGYDGGEAVNYKSDCEADIAYNLIYDANTNGFKLSNAGFMYDQSDLNVYNNTLVNSGWRRPKVKGGSIWLETNILVNLCNNLIYDCRWGLKHSTSETEDQASVLTPNFYYASTQKGVDQMQAKEAEGILQGDKDIRSTAPGNQNPLFKKYIQQENVNINVASNEGDVPQAWNNTWDFHLSASSPALHGGTMDVPCHFSIKGLTFVGLAGIQSENTFRSPAPATYFGAFGAR
ncbi:MAG: right-handed parallel beta-helix repeat-containing protein [Bacteroidaceae bacterium]